MPLRAVFLPSRELLEHVLLEVVSNGLLGFICAI